MALLGARMERPGSLCIMSIEAMRLVLKSFCRRGENRCSGTRARHDMLFVSRTRSRNALRECIGDESNRPLANCRVDGQRACAFREGPPEIEEAFREGQRLFAGGRAHELDGQMGGVVPHLREGGARYLCDGRRREALPRSMPWGYGLDVGGFGHGRWLCVG